MMIIGLLLQVQSAGGLEKVDSGETQYGAEGQVVLQCMVGQKVFKWTHVSCKIVPRCKLVNVVAEDCGVPGISKRRRWGFPLCEVLRGEHAMVARTVMPSANAIQGQASTQ